MPDTIRARPIIFSGEMVRSLLDGRKTQTRRLLKPQPSSGFAFLGVYAPHLTAVFEDLSFDARPDETVRLPHVPGNLLWVRETLAIGDSEIKYKADGALCTDLFNEHGAGWRDEACALFDRYHYDDDRIGGRDVPSIYMPRWASRLTLEVTNVRVQRLQEISGEDALAEGVEIPRCGCEFCATTAIMCPADQSEAAMAFASLWRDIHGAGAWESNPWVAALTFRVYRANVGDLANA